MGDLGQSAFAGLSFSRIVLYLPTLGEPCGTLLTLGESDRATLLAAELRPGFVSRIVPVSSLVWKKFVQTVLDGWGWPTTSHYYYYYSWRIHV